MQTGHLAVLAVACWAAVACSSSSDDKDTTGGSGGREQQEPEARAGNSGEAGGPGASSGSGGAPECALRSATGDADDCFMEMDCGGDPIPMYVQCLSTPEVVACSCGFERADRLDVELTDLSNMAACEYAADWCAGSREPPSVEPTEPPVCTVIAEEVEASSCIVVQECSGKAEISADVTLALLEFQRSVCNYAGGGWTCHCESSDGSGPAFELSAATTPSQACYDAQATCWESSWGTAAEPLGVKVSPECTLLLAESELAYAEGDPEFCMIELTCEDGLVGTQCLISATGATDCECYDAPGSLQLQLTGAPGMAACEYSVAQCASTADPPPLELADPPVCAVSQEEADATSCIVQQDCTQTMEVSPGVSFVARHLQRSQCDLTSEAWTCGCALDGDAGSAFELPLETASTQACLDALSHCADAGG